ncbi:tetratricopeptide repeat protein [Luteimonas yindakuii]|uniref:SirB1 family protein n=1 Tax=Luteimonas yindakuii TaxID=2565782 RepID=UPI00110795C6|nr:SirB1 family protein [Luteimonas yindakuii]QCO67135.2 tetratricopeptide repeat protein [Luteimonas yindakuii]
MHERTSLPSWSGLATLDDDAIPLFSSALLIARDEYPRLDHAVYEQLIEAHTRALRPRVDSAAHWPLKMMAINRYLFDEQGYAGNHEAYHDPRNSYLNEVCERRLGIPLSLGLLQMEVARRLGLGLDGVSFPGHFLVRLPVDGGVLVMDPFNRGRPLDVDELRERALAHLDGRDLDDQVLHQILHPASNRAILVRMLRNLYAVYVQRADWDRALRCVDRVLCLLPDDADALRDRGLCYFRLRHLRGARDDLARYLQARPGAGDAERVRELLIVASGERSRLH